MTIRLTIHEVAAALHKSERWLRDWLKDHHGDGARMAEEVEA